MNKYLILGIGMMAFMGCSEDAPIMEDCMVCNDFTDSEAVLKLCDIGDDSASRTVYLSGVIVFRDVVGIESSEGFSELRCNKFKELGYFLKKD